MTTKTKSEASVCLEIYMRELGIRFEPETLLVPHRKFRLDYWCLDSHGREFAVEIDGGIFRKGGGAHTGKGHLRDLEKGNEAAIRGLHVFHFTPQQCLDGKARATLKRWLNRSQEGK